MPRPDRATLEEAEHKVREIARTIKGACPKGWGFFLALSSFGEDGFSTYMSSINREGAVKLMRELADKLERQEPHI